MTPAHFMVADKMARLVDPSLARPVIVVVGDVMLDRFVAGSVTRISPEAPIPVMQVNRETTMLGGAGNVVRNAVALGSAVRFFSLVGDDTAGQEVRRLLAEMPLVSATLVQEAGRPTTQKVRFVAQSQQLLRTDYETTRPLLPSSEADLANALTAALAGATVLVISDYGKGLLSEALLSAVIAQATAAGIPVLVDPKGHDYRRYRGATVLSPNRKELHEATLLPVANDAEVVAASRNLMATCGVSAVLATRSQDGMTLVQSGAQSGVQGGLEGGIEPGAIHHFPAQAREVFDVSGAGDTVLATLATALAIGLSLPEATEVSNVAAGIVVGKIGTAVVTMAELLAGLRHSDHGEVEVKILALEVAQEQAERWRRKGHKVGFTNGCFDLLHPGHLALLRQAKAACDRLIVGINSDASVKRLKGDSRPIQSETARATVLASLAMVDGVVIFGDDTPLDLIIALRPEVLVKGADYTVETVVGASQVIGWGGRVVLATLEPGQSTTNTISRMVKP